MIETPIHNELHQIAVTGIIWRISENKGREYLITKRSPHKKVMPNRWTVPGGGLEATDYMKVDPSYLNEESPQWYNAAEKTLRREIREEVGLEVSDVNYLLDLVFIRPDGVPVLVLSYYCKYESGEVVLDVDATEFAWVSIDAISEYDLISGIDHEIKLADERLNKS
jgi:8-oxo-dGTP pyrophosphatase MutT (NUDIX family)